MPRFVNENSRDDDQSFDYLLVVGRDTEKVESVFLDRLLCALRKI